MISFTLALYALVILLAGGTGRVTTTDQEVRRLMLRLPAIGRAPTEARLGADPRVNRTPKAA